jgi:HAD superfamily hydrolase (TIGR01509 family)
LERTTPQLPERIAAVVFDFDGTLTAPDALDFPLIKRQLGCPADTPILEFIDGLPSARARTQARDMLDRFELDAAHHSKPNHGAEDLIAFLKTKQVPMALLSRNSRHALDIALAHFSHTQAEDFAIIISRDDHVAPKPSPEGVLKIANHLGVPVNQVLVVGDFIFDIQAGRQAGACTAYLSNGTAAPAASAACDVTIERLPDLIPIIRLRLPLPMGKLPNDLLENFLAPLGNDDPAVIVPPRIGEDTAAVTVADEDIIVLKSDPITFVTDAIGYFAVLINANDIATSGGIPRWFLTALLFPPGITAIQIRHAMEELQQVCRAYHITLCGGHTEITDAVTRPVVTGTLIGTVRQDTLIDKRAMRPGDHILMTKTAAVEGTAIIAQELGLRLRELGLQPEAIEAGQAFAEQISVLPEAQIARDCGGVTAMHDVTEGGIATALWELSAAGRHFLKIDPSRISIDPLTARYCRLLKIDPLGLIGSGSLLICCQSQVTQKLMDAIQQAGIAVAHIGEVQGQGRGIRAFRGETPTSWPVFEVDELARIF